MKSYLKIVLTILSIIIIAQACVPSKPSYEERTISSDRLVKKLEANRRKIKTFYGSGVMKINTPVLEASASFEVQLKKPDSIKISIFGPFGIDLAEALVTKNNFFVYDVIQNKVYKGRSDSEALKSIFKVNLAFDDLLDAFAGAVNLTDKLRQAPDLYENEGDHYILTYIDAVDKKESTYNINAEDLAILDFKLESNGSVMLQGLYSDFETYEDVPIPYRTTVENRKDDQKINIEYRKIRINEEIDGLTVSVPTDAEIIEW